MTDAELEELREKMEEQRGEIRDYLEDEGVDVSTWEISGEASADPDAERDTADSD
ncbi:hypothetical protein [Salinigranum marinum]|uniref:hypothetical protein n=1 Tax=Salinigranum marinum TaxID=1515595 RepID=UPI002989AAFC|nr:hypothetical protein [Salinigranum marinum]